MSEQKLPENITWKAENHRHYKRSATWYLGFLLISAGLISYSLFIDHSIITLVMFALMIVVVFIFSTQKPRETTYKLTKMGIHTDESFYAYGIVKNFWIVYNPPVAKSVNFKTTAYINNKISFELGNENPVQVKLFLSQYISEDLDQGERLSETLARTLKI